MTDTDDIETGQPFWNPCPICSGFGTLRQYNESTHKREHVACPRCKGEGMTPRVRWGAIGDGEGK